jgi:hypothetical protein
MTRTEAIDILEKHNEWRRFDGETIDNIPMQDPKLIGEAIDISILNLRLIEGYRVNKT